jgi:transcriptional regulator with XRE-family HTH domain
MAPFGETVLAWRLARKMTQAQLAESAGLPRPNLSAIERGDREVTLRTVRALALALDIRPGVLVDGNLPDAGQKGLTRERLERIAEASMSGATVGDPRDATLANHLRAVLPAPRARNRRHARRAADRAYLMLRGAESPETLASLLDRARERQRRP